MAQRVAASTPNQIVAPVSRFPEQSLGATLTLGGPGIPFPRPVDPRPAPAWFYSALNWLDASYVDANGVAQSFCPYMTGSDVDPYERLGATRLFLIVQVDDMFRLTLAGDATSNAPLSGGTNYPNTDAGITAMYVALANSAIFASVNYCYVPGRLGPDLVPQSFDPATAYLAASPSALPVGYDPATGLRSVVLGSAVAQVVPIDDFLHARNEQVYDDNPTIVPVVTALVYDVTQNNELGATTFTLPAYYTRDRISGSNYYVSKLGQSPIFSGGPGYAAAAATTLTLESSATATIGGQTITTSTFDKGTAVAIIPLMANVDLAAVSLTYSGASPAAIFANQRIVGFYRDASWNTTLGVPIYDYGSSNANFTAVIAPLTDPVTRYDPTHPFLNGATLQNVVSRLLSAPYLYPPDRLLWMLNAAIINQGSDGGAGLSVTTAGLAFDMQSSPSATIVDRLSVPVSVTVTTTPVILRTGVPLVARIGGSQPIHVEPSPVTVQAGLSAFVPNEALSGTGIAGIEIGTPFPQQSLGAGTTFESATAGVTLNLLDRHLDTPPFAPYDLSLATAGVSFTPGVAYVLSMTGTTLTVRGSDGSSAGGVPKQAPPDPNHTFVGAMVYAAQATTVRLYPKLSLTLAAPAVGGSGVVQGSTYGVRLTFGEAESQYDVVDATQTVIASNIGIANPVPTDGSKPQPGDLYFGSFVGGATQMTLWSVPVFLTVAPSSLPGASFNGNMTLDALTSGLPSYELQISDSSLFVYSNFNVDTMAAGSASSNNVFLASAVINSSPEDRSAQAFAACKALMGLVQTAQVGASQAYVFIPEDDSVVIGGTRYMVSVINLAAMGFDPNTLPYPAVLWPRTQYWQFANRHDPYADVRYTGATQIDRIAQAQADSARIGLETATAQEPMHLYLDTQSEGMTIWPIFAFPIQIASQIVDRGALQAITSTILSLLAAPPPPQAGSFVPGALDAERVTLPESLQLYNPYEAATNASAPANAAAQAVASAPTPATSAVGKTVTNLAPNAFAPSTVRGLEAHTSFDLLQTQQANAELSVAKSQVAAPPVTQTRALESTGTTPSAAIAGRREYYSIFGYSAFDPGTGEAYIVELVGSDLQPPDVLPDPTQNADYDPYYVRVVFLRTLTCYNMSIIVPAMVHDQYGHLAHIGTTYDNLLSKIDELTLGYMYSLYDASNNFDSLTFAMYGFEREAIAESQSYLLTNLPYTLKQTASFSPLSLFSGMTHSAFSFDPALISYRPTPTPQPYFVCRRKNWSADCHLMQATHPQGTALYMAFGGGDIVPFRLDAQFDVDKRQPAHMYKLTYTFTDQPYLDAKTILVGNTPYVVATTQQGNGLQFVNFSINATAGTADVQMTPGQTLLFPPECYVAGAASTTLTAVSATSAANAGIYDTGGFVMHDSNGNPFVNFVAVPYNNLVYLVRAVAAIQALGEISGFASVSGLLIDTYVPSSTGNLNRAQGARYQRSGMSYFGSSYTPTTMVDSLDTLDFTSITGETFYAPTIFIPIPEIDATKSFVANISNLLIGAAYDDYGTPMPLGGPAGTAGFGNVRSVYLFNAAIRPDGIRTGTGSNDVVDVSSATTDQLNQAGIAGYWVSQYDPNDIVNNPLDSSAPAVPTNNYQAYLAPLAGYEFPATTLYVNGYAMTLSLLPTSSIPSSFGYPGGAMLIFNAGVYRMQELSVWNAPRQAYQVIDDMFGRLVSSNEPTLVLYVSGSIALQAIGAPALPLNKYIDGTPITNAVTQMTLAFFPASLDLAGCPAVGRCGPLISPNLYNPPGVALTVCDTVPDLTTYSVTFNTTTPGLAGEINEAYVYVKDNVLTLYAGKKVGDLQLTWISQEQGDVQLIGYIEGAPPCPMANLTNKPGTTFLEPTTVYPGATAITFTAPTAVKLDYRSGDKTTNISNWTLGGGAGLGFGIHVNVAPFGFGIHVDKTAVLEIHAAGSYTRSWDDSNNTSDQEFTSTQKLDETNRYTLKLQGTLAPITADPFMAGLNTLTTPSATPGNPSTKTAILPNPNLGGFTVSNPPGALPSKTPGDEKFGTRMFLPSPYGEAFVTSATLDVYQQKLVQTGTVYGFVSVPNAQIPRDLNIVSFRMSSKYVRPGCLDGVIGYVYNPATLPTGAQTYATSTGQMTPLYDGNFSAGEVGHDASYMRVVEAYKLKKEIDQQAYNALALYQSAYSSKDTAASDPALTPGLDFYNEYVWSSRGGAQEVKHTFSTTFDQVLVTSTVNQVVEKIPFNLKISAAAQYLEFEGMYKKTHKETVTYRYGTTASAAFDIAASFDGIETDTQMRYACNNDAHFVMNFNSTFNSQNQSGVNLVIGSDGLVYNVVPSVTSGAGLPLSDNIDDSRDYMQPQPSYSSGNADGLSGALEPYDRPGKTKLYRTLAFFLQPSAQNNEDFWSTVVDQVWLNNSTDSDAAAMRSAMQNVSLPWRMLYRVTYSERFLPPVSTEAIMVPQITPVMAVPVINPSTDFLYLDPGAKGPRPAHNPANDIEANVVLVAPTASGKSAGGSTLPNNVIPFDLMKTLTAPVSWGDSANTAILTKLVTSVLGNNVLTMSPRTLPGSTKVTDVMDPVSGGVLYSVYTDPNGLTVNVPVNFSLTVYADVNGNPIQYYDGKGYHSLQADYVASPDGMIAYYIQPPSSYDQSAFNLLGDYDLFGHPGDQWRYFLLSGFSSNMTSDPTVNGQGPFLSSSGATPYTGFTIATAQHAAPGVNQVAGYVLVQGVLQWPHLNTNAETFADVQVYKAMSVLDTFPIGDPGVLIEFLTAQYPDAPFSLPPPGNADIQNVFARNIISYFNAAQQALIPQ